MSGKEGVEARKVLVVYYSLSGNTARVARDIARRLGADVESLHDNTHGVGFVGYLKAVADAVRGMPAAIGEPTRDPRDYALTIVGTPVWAWHMTPAVRAYLRKCGDRFNGVAFFVTSGDTDAAKVVPAMETEAKHKALAFAGFNARELGAAPAYEARLAEFLKALKSAPGSCCVDAAEPLHVR